MKSHRQQVDVEGEWHPHYLWTLNNTVTWYWMGLTKHMAHQFHVEHAHLKMFIAPPLLHPSINHVKSLTLTRVGQSYRSHVVSESVTALPPALFTLRLQLRISPRQNMWGNTQTNFACAKMLSLKATTVNSSSQNYIWHFWQKTDTSRSLVLLQEYWQVKCYLQHHKLKQHKSPFAISW